MSRKQARTRIDRRPTDEQLLAEFARTRSPTARAQLLEEFAPFARALAMRYRGGREENDDLVQVAMIGLIHAIDRYSPDRGSFQGFAAPTILGELRHHLRDHVWAVRVPRRLQELIMRTTSVASDLAEELGRDPTTGELADRCELDLETVVAALEAKHARSQFSLDVPVSPDGMMTMVETIRCTEPGYERVESNMAVPAAELTTRECRVLRMSYGEGMRQAEIGQILGVSQMQVSRIARSALAKLLAAVGDEPDDPRTRLDPRRARQPSGQGRALTLSRGS